MGYAISKPMNITNKKQSRDRLRFVVVRLLMATFLCWSTPTLGADQTLSFKNQTRQDLILMQGRYEKFQEIIAQEYRDLKVRKTNLEKDVQRLRKENREMLRHPSIFRFEDRNIKKNKVAIVAIQKKIVVLRRKMELKANEFKTQKDVLKTLTKEIAARTVQEQNLVIKVLAMGAPKLVQDTRESVRKSIAPQFEKIHVSKNLLGKVKWPLALFIGLSLIAFGVLSRRKAQGVFLRYRRATKPKSPAIDLPPDLQQEIEGLQVAAKDRIQYI